MVRFAATPAGRVAYAVTGSGPAVLCLPGWVSHLGLLWESAEHRRFVEELSRTHTVIRFDRIGCGLSDRDRTDFSLEFELATLKALIAHLGLDRFALFGTCESGQVAAAFAAAEPDALTALILYGTCARGRDLAPGDVRRSVLGMVRAHWGLGSRVLADIWLPDASTELSATFARMQREAATAETAAALLEMFYLLDVTDVLSEIRVPTLVAHRRGSRAVRFELGRELAALIPEAQLAALDGRMQPIYAEHPEAGAATIAEFLHATVPARANTPPAAADPPPTAAQTARGLLTAREFQVADLIADGLTNAEIGRQLGVSMRTVDAHVEHVRTKLGVRARAQIAVWARQNT
ncbi:LuxR family transcriptional regulator [Actinoplanes ianthinogenes]|uniref:LuxR family transcriptional regulator n=1 Tax=Actinoplanes ianthinogenes TaxID=122358 RepID=A0ABM7LKM6_9ACTN|nr:LuxR family transcriptional regulator [Actinoplanes ianthinogenes]GGR08330.1 LuxR family transcriptional regulator [Actinoplanes ianthinogenes]